MKRASGYLMGFVLLVGILNMIGWGFNIEILKNPFTNNVMMLPITAMSLIMGAFSFFLLYKTNPRKEFTIVARLLAVGVLCVGFLKSLANAGFDVGIYHWPFPGKDLYTGPRNTGPSFVVVITSAIGYVIAALGLLFSGLKGKWPGRIITTLALFGLIIGMFAFIGFIYDVKEFYGILPYMSVAPATTACFICFSLAMLFENSSSGFMATFSSRNLGGKVARPLIPVGILVPFVFGFMGIYIARWLNFSDPLGVATLNTSIVVVFLVVLWILANILNKSDAKREQAEMQLEQQAQLFNITPDAVLYGNEDLIITDLNPAAKRAFDVKDAEIGHIRLDELFTGENSGGIANTLRPDLWGEKGAWRGESDLITRSGQKINALATFKVIKNSSGQKVGWTGVYTDISLLRLNEELKTANSYLEQLAFISAHDIKSPILTLQGLTDMMYNSGKIQGPDLQMLDMQKKVIAEMQRTNNALNEILKLRQSLVGKDSSNGETISMGVIISNIAGILRSDMEQTGTKLETDIAEVAKLKFPRVYFQSLFYNLVANSIKYRRPDLPPVIKISGRRTGPTTVKFTVEDNGLGFDVESNKGKIFGMFKRFHAHVDGTGVGLHIVKSIVDAFDGTIEVESEPDKGTKFEMTFSVKV